jgi:hypothetical protein
LEGYQAARLREEENFRRAEAAETELQGLREAVEAAVEHHQTIADDPRRDRPIRNAHGAVARRFQRLLDTGSADEASAS